VTLKDWLSACPVSLPDEVREQIRRIIDQAQMVE
jgi:hypothetical protein